MNRQLYRMHDVRHGGAIACTESEARRFNTAGEGFGVFWTVNDFNGARRIENLRTIRSWAIDIDTGTKDEQAQKISKAPLVPSLVIEVKRGFHVYYDAIDAAPEHWNAIVLDRLVPYYGADANARDLARILRAPGYLHLKDPADPFPVRIVAQPAGGYREMQIAERFPDHGAARRVEAEQARERRQMAAGRAPANSADRAKRYAEAAFMNEIRAVECQAEGGRNARLFRAAAALGQLVAGGVLAEREVSDALHDAAARAGLGDGEIVKTIASGMRAGQRQPRGVPEVRA